MLASTEIAPIEARVAAAWWADCLRDCAASDTGDAALTVTINAFAGLERKPAPLPPERIDSFENILCGYLTAKLYEGREFEIAIDYSPPEWLCELAGICGISIFTGRFPVKTFMVMERGRVVVWPGYGSARRTLYAPESAEAGP